MPRSHSSNPHIVVVDPSWAQGQQVSGAWRAAEKKRDNGQAKLHQSLQQFLSLSLSVPDDVSFDRSWSSIQRRLEPAGFRL